MSLRIYYNCKNCGFRYVDVRYYYCFRDDTGCIEKYESLFSTVGYSDGSIVRGRVIQQYCKNCDKIVSIYQTGLGSSLFDRDSTIDFLREFIPKKKEKLLKTTVLLNKLVDLVESDASLDELDGFLREHDDQLYFKIDLNEYLSENSFKDMDFYIKDYVKRDALAYFNEKALSRSDLYNLPNDALNHIHSYDLDMLHSRDLDLKSLYNDISNHLNTLTASDLNIKEFYRDINDKFDYLSDELMAMEREIICINYLGDEYNLSLDGDIVDVDVCPDCGEEFYLIDSISPCPRCGKTGMECEHVFYD